MSGSITIPWEDWGRKWETKASTLWKSIPDARMETLPPAFPNKVA